MKIIRWLLQNFPFRNTYKQILHQMDYMKFAFRSKRSVFVSSPERLFLVLTQHFFISNDPLVSIVLVENQIWGRVDLVTNKVY